MPELPSVELFKRYFDQHALNQVIETVEVRSPELVVEVDPQTLKRSLEGHEFISSRRHGKYLFSRLEDPGQAPLFLGILVFLHAWWLSRHRFLPLCLARSRG